MLHPKYTIEREYIAVVENAIVESELKERLADGVETVEDGNVLVVQAQLLDVDGQSVRLSVTEGKYRMVRRILANAGHPVTALHRIRYGEVLLEKLGIEEGDVAAIDGAALDWARSLRTVKALKTRPLSTPWKGRSQGSNHNEIYGVKSGGVVDPHEAMRAAWMPRAADVRLVSEEAGVSREEAITALKKHKGDIVAALLEL